MLRRHETGNSSGKLKSVLGMWKGNTASAACLPPLKSGNVDRDRRAGATACWIWAVLLGVLLVRAYLQPAKNTVYPIFANAVREWHEGIDLYDPRFYHGVHDKYRYAPIVTVWFIPFAVFPDAIGGVLWRICNAAVFLGGFIAFARTVFPGQARLSGRMVLLLSLLLLPLGVGSLNNGQPNSLIVGCLMLGAAATLSERWNLAALCLAVPVMVKVYPISVAALYFMIQPRLGWRVGALIVLGFLAPFMLHEPQYVGQLYQSWVDQVGNDNRQNLPFESSYRDFHTLMRVAGLPIDGTVYMGLQLAMAGLVGGVVLRGYRLGWGKAHHLRAAFELGCCWIIMFGPATENCTYALLAPTMALAGYEAFQPGRPAWQRCWVLVGVLWFVGGSLAGVTPIGKSVSYAVMPLGGLMLLAERLCNYWVAEESQSCYVDSGPLPLVQ
jgi:hypothetical protein